MNMTKLEVAGIQIDMQTVRPIKITRNFEPFMKEKLSCCTGWKVEFCEVENLPKVTGEVVASNPEITIFRNSEGGYWRCYHDSEKYKERTGFYAVAHSNLEERKVQIDYLPDGAQYVCEIGNSFFHIGWEAMLMHERRMILHASSIDTPYGGILFSGPSGVGKSTQSDLWCEHMKSVLINGDRPIIGKDADGWKAYGSPYAGSSGCHVDASCEICAVVLLQQGSNNTIRRLDRREAFGKLYRETTINSWDAEFVSTIFDLLNEFTLEIPVYELICTPDIQAVEILKNELLKEDRM